MGRTVEGAVGGGVTDGSVRSGVGSTVGVTVTVGATDGDLAGVVLGTSVAWLGAEETVAVAAGPAHAATVSTATRSRPAVLRAWTIRRQIM